MMLQDKVAVIYGAGGAIGSAVARAFASEGATVFLTGREAAPVEAVAGEIVAGGGSAEAAEVDALDERGIDEHLRSVIAAAGGVDISFNAVGIPDATILGVPLVDLDIERFRSPIVTYATSYFLTARLAARHMISEKRGRDHEGHRAALADRNPAGGRLRPGDGGHGGAHPGPLRRARAPRHPGRRACGRRRCRRRTRSGRRSSLAPRHRG